MVMQDMKEFWKNIKAKHKSGIPICTDKQLGMFFWERGGNQFVEEHKQMNYNDILRYAHPKYCYDTYDFLFGRDFLDCVSCLGETKVKELIKNMKGK